MANSIFSPFHCDNATQFAVHIACYHWGLESVPSGLLEELERIESERLNLATELKRLKTKYAHQVPA